MLKEDRESERESQVLPMAPINMWDLEHPIAAGREAAFGLLSELQLFKSRSWKHNPLSCWNQNVSDVPAGVLDKRHQSAVVKEHQSS